MLLTNRFQVRVRALEDQLSLGKDGKLRHEFLEVLKQVRRNDDRPILGKFTEEGSHPDPGCRVEADCRLIEQQHSRISDNCTRDSKPLAHSTRKRLDAIIGAVDKPHTIKGRTCPYTALPRFNSSRPCRIFHGPPDAKMQREGKPLGQESDHTTNGIDVIADIDTIHPKMTGLRFL